jgi:stearoyl-CoA desaturase (delta-9 desaturase)
MIYLGFVLWGITLYALIVGGLNPAWLLLSLVGYVFFAVVNTAGYHRLFCHRAYKTSLFWENTLLYFGACTGYGSTLQWCVAHNEHHAHADTNEDPHQFKNFLDVITPNYINNPYTERRWIRPLLRNRWHLYVHRWYWLFPLSLALLLYFVGDEKLVIYAYLLPVTTWLFVGTVFNWLAHRDGDITDSQFWAYVMAGEGWHGKHHRSPGEWKLHDSALSDLGGALIKIIRR